MIILALVFAGIGLFELQFMHYHNRKKRTYWIVLAVLTFACLYVGSVYLWRDAPNPNAWIDAVFHRVQDRMLGV